MLGALFLQEPVNNSGSIQIYRPQRNFLTTITYFAYQYELTLYSSPNLILICMRSFPTTKTSMDYSSSPNSQRVGLEKLRSNFNAYSIQDAEATTSLT